MVLKDSSIGTTIWEIFKKYMPRHTLYTHIHISAYLFLKDHS